RRAHRHPEGEAQRHGEHVQRADQRDVLVVIEAVVFAQVGTSPAGRLLVDFLSLGSIYALLAMGFVIIFKATQVLNFAHGALAGLGAFLVASFATVIQVPGRRMPDAPVWLRWTLPRLAALALATLCRLV